MALEQCTSVTEKLIYNREGDAPSGVNRAHTHALRAELPFLWNYSSPVEQMNITLVPGGNMVVLSSSISAKVSKLSCRECKEYNTTTQSPTQQHNEPQQKILGG